MQTIKIFCSIATFLTPFIFAGAQPHAAWAQDLTYFTPLSGWTHPEPLSNDSPQQHGVILNYNQIRLSSPVIADLDGDLSNGREVVVASSEGVITALSSSGAVLWETTTPNYSCALTSKSNKIYSSPAVGELYGDGVPYVVVGYGGIIDKRCSGGVVALRGTDGAQSWVFDLKAFSRKKKLNERFSTVFSTPALADTDGDGKMEIGFGSYDRHVYLLNSNGKPRWFYQAADTVWSSPSFVNLDNTPQLEMVIGTDISANKRIKPPTSNGGFLYAFKTTGRRGKKILFRDPSAFLWKTYFNQVLYASPVTGDLIPSSAGSEIAIGSGCFFPQGKLPKNGAWFKVVSGSTGAVLATLEVDTCSSSSPAVADLNADGLPELVVHVNGSPSIGGSGHSRLIAWTPSTNQVLWEITPTPFGANVSPGLFIQSPTVADLDGNGSLEVILPSGRGIGVYNGIDGSPLSAQVNDGSDELPVLRVWGELQNSVAIGDLKGDGKLALIAAGLHSAAKGRGVVYGWGDFAEQLNSLPAQTINQPPYATPWPMWRGSEGRSG